jgi:hypothetical protein
VNVRDGSEIERSIDAFAHGPKDVENVVSDNAASLRITDFAFEGGVRSEKLGLDPNAAARLLWVKTRATSQSNESST